MPPPVIARSGRNRCPATPPCPQPLATTGNLGLPVSPQFSGDCGKGRRPGWASRAHASFEGGTLVYALRPPGRPQPLHPAQSTHPPARIRPPSNCTESPSAVHRVKPTVRCLNTLLFVRGIFANFSAEDIIPKFNLFSLCNEYL